MRVIFFGMECQFSRPPLEALLRSGVEVRAVVVPRPSAVALTSSPPSYPPGAPSIRPLAPPKPSAGTCALPMAPSGRGIVGLARAAGVPVLEAGQLAAPDTLDALRDLRPDLFVVACFPRLLPPALLRLPRHGALNVHPSLLPAYRGPAPLFWIFHDGLERAGVTVHLMDAGADTGAIAVREPLALPDGISYAGAERLCAEEGARLLVAVAPALAAGTLIPRPQPPTGVSHAPAPRPEDFIVTPDWPARRAFNLMRGVADWGYPVGFRVNGERLVVRETVAFDEGAALDVPIERAGDRVRLRCSPGVLTCDVS